MSISAPGTPRELQEIPNPETAEEFILVQIRQLFEAELALEQNDPRKALEVVSDALENWQCSEFYDCRVGSEFRTE
jgi:hypothetical protein